MTTISIKIHTLENNRIHEINIGCEESLSNVERQKLQDKVQQFVDKLDIKDGETRGSYHSSDNVDLYYKGGNIFSCVFDESYFAKRLLGVLTKINAENILDEI